MPLELVAELRHLDVRRNAVLGENCPNLRRKYGGDIGVPCLIGSCALRRVKRVVVADQSGVFCICARSWRRFVLTVQVGDTR
jgi:hypothetical protein